MAEPGDTPPPTRTQPIHDVNDPETSDWIDRTRGEGKYAPPVTEPLTSDEIAALKLSLRGMRTPGYPIPVTSGYMDRLVATVEAAEAEVRALTARLDAAIEGLQAIAEPDALLDANEDAFNEHAARWMKAQAQVALRAATADPTPHTDTD